VEGVARQGIVRSMPVAEKAERCAEVKARSAARRRQAGGAVALVQHSRRRAAASAAAAPAPSAYAAAAAQISRYAISKQVTMRARMSRWRQDCRNAREAAGVDTQEEARQQRSAPAAAGTR